MNLGNLYRTSGHAPNKAIECYAKVLEIDPDHVDTLVNFGDVLRSEGQPSTGLRLIERALAIDATHPFALASACLCHYQLGQIADAASAIGKCLELHPHHSMCQRVKAAVLA